MTFSMFGKAVAALLVAGCLCACAAPQKKDDSVQSIPQPTYKPTGSHIVERSDGKRSPKNSSTAPVQDLEHSPAVTVIQNQAPK
jgi:hypothetical protein